MIVLALALGLSTLVASAEPNADAAPEAPPRIERHDGANLLVVPAPPVVTHGEVVTYRVLVETKYAALADEFAHHVDDSLADPDGWAAAGYTFAATDGEADITIILAAPKTTDRMCAPLLTGGSFSCGRKGRVVINARRFKHGATTYRGKLEQYRTYVVNHEVGHLLGFDHRACPGRGMRAPVMLQQTKSLAGCKRGTTPRAEEVALLAARPPRYLAKRSIAVDPAITAAAAGVVVGPAREGRAPLRAAP
jgi:hypothetical protein